MVQRSLIAWDSEEGFFEREPPECGGTLHGGEYNNKIEQLPLKKLLLCAAFFVYITINP